MDILLQDKNIFWLISPETSLQEFLVCQMQGIVARSRMT